MSGSFSVCLVLALALLPSALAVIFAKGREQRFDNGYVETTNSNFQLECVKWHNYFRKLHGAQPLQYSTSLAEYARRRAVQLATKDGTNFYHLDDLPYGENLAWNSQEPIDCGLPLKLWYDEWKIYNFQRPNVNPANGHFTQMVWKESAQIGCGQAISKGKNGGTYTVCNYDPPGNYENEELENVSPAIGGAYYDFSNESRYKQKKIKIHTTTNHHDTTTHTFSNGQYQAHNDQFQQKYQKKYQSNYQASSNNYGSQSYGGGSKWFTSFRPQQPTYSYSYSKPTYTSYSKPATYNSYSRPSSTSYSYRPNFKMSLGGNSLW